MRWPWKSPPAELEELQHRVKDAADYVERAEAIAEARKEVTEEVSTWLRDRRERNHLTELFFSARGGR